MLKQVVTGACFALVVGISTCVAAPLDGTAAAGPRRGRAISENALAKAQGKFTNALQVAAQFESAADAEGLPSTWRSEMITALMRAPEGGFGQVRASATARDALIAAHDISASPSIVSSGFGDINDDLTFIPLATPCRVVDTRASGAGGPLIHASRAFTLSGGVAQGGSASCTAFAGYITQGNPGAVAVNIVADASGYTAAVGSFLRAYPDGGTTGTSWLNFATGQVVANAGVLGVNTTNAKFDVFVNATADIIVDVYGSFIPPDPTPLECTTSTSNTVSSGVVAATCPFNYTVTGGGCASNSIYDYAYSASITGNGYSCSIATLSGHVAGSKLTASAQCCRVPGRSEPEI